eukprot:2292880-Rhodomonas_salina.1
MNVFRTRNAAPTRMNVHLLATPGMTVMCAISGMTVTQRSPDGMWLGATASSTWGTVRGW